MTYEEKNLIALVFASNECFTNVVELSAVSEREVQGTNHGKPHTWKWAKIELNLKKRTWKHGRKHGNIGGSCRYEDDGSKNECGLIGIYDRTNIDHLDYMVHDGKEATTDHNWNGE